MLNIIGWNLNENLIKGFSQTKIYEFRPKVNKAEITFGITLYRSKRNFSLRTKFLRQCINSILGQKTNNYKIVIGNDNPNFPLNFKELNIKKFKNIHCKSQEKLREENNMNYLMRVSQTKWFMWLSDDDYLLPNFLKTVQYDLGKNYAVIYSNYLRSYSLKQINKIFLNENLSQIYDTKNFHRVVLSRKIKIQGASGLINLKKLKKLKGIKTLGNSYGPWSDILMALELSSLGKVKYFFERLLVVRVHEDSLSVNKNLNAFYSAKLDFIRYYINQFKFLDYRKNLYYFNIWFVHVVNLIEKNSELKILEKIKIYFNLKKNIFY